MNKFLNLILGLLVSFPSLAHDFNYTYGGQTLLYTVVDEVSKTCITHPGSNIRWPYTTGNSIVGDLIIPAYVTDPTSTTEIQYKVVGLGVCAFYDCKDLTSIILPESITDIGPDAFSNCSGLTSVVIPESVTSIGEYAFSKCSGLTSVTIPESVTTISPGAFSNCSGLTSVVIPESVTSIGASAFSNCSGLTSVAIPNSVSLIGSHAFLKCSNLITINLPESITEIGGKTFAFCSSLTSISIPESVTSIGGAAFEECSGLTSVTIPESVISISGHAFDGCANLTSVTIPGSITFVGGEAGQVFENCPKLSHIYYNTENPLKCNDNNFSTLTYTSATLYVPEEALERCKRISPWKNFQMIVAYEFSGIEEISEPFDVFLPYEVYTYGGMKITDSMDNLPKGSYIIRQGKFSKKIVVR